MVCRGEYKKDDNVIIYHNGNVYKAVIAAKCLGWNEGSYDVFCKDLRSISGRPLSSKNCTVYHYQIISYDDAIKENIDILNLKIYFEILSFFYNIGHGTLIAYNGVTDKLIERLYSTFRLDKQINLLSDDDSIKFKDYMDYKIGETMLLLNSTLVCQLTRYCTQSVVSSFQDVTQLMEKIMKKKYNFEIG